MSGKPTTTGPKPQAPKVFKKGKFEVKLALEPKIETGQASQLTIVPSSENAQPEDKGPAPVYSNIAATTGMFQVSSAKSSAVASGTLQGKQEKKPRVNVSRPLALNFDTEEGEEEEQEAPPPPPQKPLAPKAESVTQALPSVAKEFLGLAKPEKKSYAEAAVKARMTEDIANTLIDLEEQLEAMKLGGVDFDTLEGLTAETKEGKTTYTFGQSFEETGNINEAKLRALDDLFPSLRVTMKSLSGEGSLEEGSTSQFAKDYVMLKRLMTYAPKFKKDRPQLEEKKQARAIKDMMTDEMADTLIDLKTTLEEMGELGIGINMDSMTEIPPEGPGKPYIYEFQDGNSFLLTFDEEEKAKAEKRLADLAPLFPGRTKITLTKLIGLGPLTEEGTPLQKDIAFLPSLYKLAEQHKIEGKVTKEIVNEFAEKEAAARVESLEGTEYEALAKPIEDEMSKAPYEVTTDSSYKPGTYKDKTGKDALIPQQKGFIPQSRRAFGYFIYDKYRRYMLKALDKLDPNACQALGSSSNLAQIYEYQKFVRDYISFMTPYRGVLVYHGLGSGKTCTAIAASEALLSSGGKKRIIVMTPFSLRKNFIQQITFCGFRHFRLLNYWTSQEYTKGDGKNALWLFATSVLRIPESYLMPRKGKPIRIWIPDLTKSPSEENYSKLSGSEQSEIRNQIYETLVYDPYKGKNGLIWFINYNGISASRLRDLACKVPADAFDDSVIVVDEIHNLVRLMQGTIDPYLKKMYIGQIEYDTKQDSKYLDPERITSAKWRPKYCGKTMNYKRGYLFYRLLVEARNSKIIGLSGTPLINFPEELGILANVLHGYNFIYTAKIPKVSEPNGNKRIVDGLKTMAEGNDPSNFCPYVDFYEAIIDDRAASIEFTFTFLPEGYRKIQGQLGVERIPSSEKLPAIEDKLVIMRACMDKVLQSINTAYKYVKPFAERAEPLLPVMGESSFPEAKQLDDSFKGRFIDADGVSIMNQQILMKRLSGLVSYYKGSRKDLMPEVKPGDDVIVRVPMSLEQQRKYIAIRLGEIQIEKQKEAARRGPVEVGGPRGDDAELKKLSSSQNYRMASRQACNFTFPDGFTRPRPMSAKDLKEANELGGNLDDLVGDDSAAEASALVRSSKEEAEAKAEDAREAEAAERDDEAISFALEEEEVKQKQEELKGKPEGEIQAAVKAIRERYDFERSGGLLVAAAAGVEEPAKSLTPEQKRCLANKLDESETYQMAINRAKECLLKYAFPKLLLQDPSNPSQSPLAKCSTKYKAMIENINAIPGSSLVYSQFLGMEGIGIFTIVLQANGYVPLKVVLREGVEGRFEFDEATEASLRKGPAAMENRFILFTGGEDEDIRKVNIDLFNAKFSELPPRINQVLRESGFTDEIGNKRGELCRVFCITAAGAEGLSLKNVRGVHIMEPYWNDVRMAQVKGRAVRICSHQDLPLKDRNVKIFTYISIFDPMAQDARGNVDDARNQWAIPQDIWMRDFLDKKSAEQFGLSVAATKGEYAMTSDERLYFISERKKALVENLIIVMKTAAADCLLNYKENRDGTYICRLLGNEGDFLYHPNLQKDIESSKHDEIGDIFKVPAEEVARIKEADAKLSFEEGREEEKEKEKEEETKEEEKEKPATTAVAKAEEAPKPVVVQPKKITTTAAPEPQRISYPVKIGDKQYKVSALPDATGKVDKFFVYDAANTSFTTAVGQAEAEFKDKWIPKKGTVRFYPKK